MSNKQNLLTTYEQMLGLGGMIVSEDGMVSSILSGQPTPANVGVDVDEEKQYKRLVLPTPQQLKMDGGWDKRIPFHPLKEKILSGESQVCRYLREKINYRLNMIIRGHIDSILDCAVSSENQKKITAKELKLLETAAAADETTCKNFTKLMNKVPVTDTKHSFVSIYLKKMGKIKNESYSCVAVVSFPFYEELIKADKTFHGVKLRKADFETLRLILEYILPNITDPEYYKTGVHSSIAPFTESLIHATDKIAEQVNKITDVLFKQGKYFSKEEAQAMHDILYIKRDHMPVFDDLESLLPEIRLIPTLAGNENPEPKTKQPEGKPLSDIAKEFESVKKEEQTTSRWETIKEPIQPNLNPEPHTDQLSKYNINTPPPLNQQQFNNQSSGDGISLRETSWYQQCVPQTPPWIPPAQPTRQGILQRLYTTPQQPVNPWMQQQQYQQPPVYGFQQQRNF